MWLALLKTIVLDLANVSSIRFQFNIRQRQLFGLTAITKLNMEFY